MEFFINLLTKGDVVPSLIFIAITAFVGVAIGKIEIKNVKLGVAGVLFAGLIAAHFGAKIDPHILHFVREFGLILFVYAVGIDIGPRFFSTLRKDGLKLNLFAASIVLLGFCIASLFHFVGGVPSDVITGVMSGAVTNTPGLGAAQQILTENGRTESAEIAGMGYAVAYPFGVLGIILTMILIRAFFKIKVSKEVDNYNEQNKNDLKKLESVTIKVTNPSLFGKTVGYIRKVIDKELVVSRIERKGDFFVASENMAVEEGDIIHGVSEVIHLDNIQLKIGQVEIAEKKEISGDLAMENIMVTSRKVAGKTIEQIGIYRRYEANITRIFRAGEEILPTRSTTIELGDAVRVVGKKALLPDVQKELGNSTKELSIPNTLPIFLGIFLGVILGSIPIFIPGIPAPAKLGLAGGPLLVAILLGYKGRIGKLDFYIVPGANMLLREFGIILFLAAVGLSSGEKFVATISNGGYMWMLYGAAITFIPIFIVASVARIMKYNYLKICGIISGSMTDPPALEFANSLAPVQAQSTAYATVYPFTMFLRILAAQALILLTF